MMSGFLPPDVLVMHTLLESKSNLARKMLHEGIYFQVSHARMCCESSIINQPGHFRTEWRNADNHLKNCIEMHSKTNFFTVECIFKIAESFLV